MRRPFGVLHRWVISREQTRVILGERCRNAKTLRICDYGDLIPELVRVINILARWYPDIRLWVTTRRPELACHIDRRAKNVTVWFSVDRSRRAQATRTEMAKHGHPLVHYSFLRTDTTPPPADVELIFNLQQKKDTLPVDDRACPADVPIARGGLAVSGACETCGFCGKPGPVPPLELNRRRRADER